MDKIDLNSDILKKIEVNKNYCINCKQCFNVCPMMKEYSSAPKKLMEEMLCEKKVDKNIPYSCMNCDVCKVKCPKDIDLKEMFYNMRVNIFTKNTKGIKELGMNTIRFHQINSFSSIFSRSFIDKSTRKVFLPGCSISAYDADLVLKTYDYLNSNIKDLGLIFECCSKPTLSLGDKDKFNQYYYRLEKLFKENNINEVIVACPNCYKTIKENSPNVKVTLIWEVINKYGLPKKLENYYNDISIEFSLHDPCPVRYENNVHEDVRKILYKLGIKVVEFDQNRKKTQCCGAGAMVGVTNPKVAKKQMERRSREAKTENIICYCQSCCESMISVGKPTIHILDLLFNNMVINKNKFYQEKTTVINKWKTRYKGVHLGKKLKK